ALAASPMTNSKQNNACPHLRSRIAVNLLLFLVPTLRSSRISLQHSLPDSKSRRISMQLLSQGERKDEVCLRAGVVSYLVCCRRNSLAESLPVFVIPADAGIQVFLLCLIGLAPGAAFVASVVS